MTAQKVNDAPRRPGRPRGTKAGTANREQLMDIALALFARHGIAPVSLNAIAREAGVTPAMLHYYFTSRDALVEQLLIERFIPLRNEIGEIFSAHAGDPVVAFRLLIETLAVMAENNAWLAPLWMQEVIGEMPVMRQLMHQRFGGDKYASMLDNVRRWQQEGKLNPALAPELLFTSVISLVLVPFSRIRADERLQALDREAIARHALAFMMAGIAGNGSPEPAGEPER
ncbi:TPA: TetR/AcrR family transcriptional regulator [Citrobacter freundii]